MRGGDIGRCASDVEIAHRPPHVVDPPDRRQGRAGAGHVAQKIGARGGQAPGGVPPGPSRSRRIRVRSRAWTLSATCSAASISGASPTGQAWWAALIGSSSPNSNCFAHFRQGRPEGRDKADLRAAQAGMRSRRSGAVAVAPDARRRGSARSRRRGDRRRDRRRHIDGIAVGRAMASTSACRATRRGRVPGAVSGIIGRPRPSGGPDPTGRAARPVAPDIGPGAKGGASRRRA